MISLITLEAVDHYARCNAVKYIYVIWSEKSPPSQEIRLKFAAKKHPQVTSVVTSLRNNNIVSNRSDFQFKKLTV